MALYAGYPVSPGCMMAGKAWPPRVPLLARSVVGRGTGGALA